MEQILYRKIKIKDYKYIKNMMNKNFHLYKYIEDERILKPFLNSYLYSCLAEKTFSSVAEKDGKIIGIILGKANNDKNILNILKSAFYMTLYFFYILITFFKSILYKTDIKQYKGITKIYKILMEKANKKFDGVLTLFVVSENFQGYGIGKNLLKNFFEYEKKFNSKNIYVYTDSNCNYKFYDKQGFIKLSEDTFNVKNKIKNFDLDIFLYEYKF